MSFRVCCCSCVLLNAPKRSDVEAVSNDALSVFTRGNDDINVSLVSVLCIFRLAFSWRHILIPYHLSSQCMFELRFKFDNHFQGCSFSDTC